MTKIDPKKATIPFYCLECEEYFYGTLEEYEADKLVCDECQRDENIITMAAKLEMDKEEEQ